MDLDDEMMPYSPSADSSASSSDLDTESTGSFFPDRSTTLGTLMGVSAFGGQRRSTRAPPGEASEGPARAAAAEEEEGRRAGGWRRRRRRPRGGSWWRLCRDDTGGPPTRLGEFLDMERQLAGADFLCESGGGPQVPEAASVAATALFEDGRVRPPQQQQQPRAAPPEERGRWRLQRAAEGSSSLARLPVLLTGICSGGAG
ncbi:unnamed protein product [Alopecurus aequalis]